MYSTYPTHATATPALLYAAAENARVSIDVYRVGTLKRCDVEISNMLDASDISEEWKDILRHLRNQVLIAIADNSRLDR